MASAIICGVALLSVRALWPTEYTPAFWSAPILITLYDAVFVWITGRFDRYPTTKIFNVSLILRGAKFLVVATLMLIYATAAKRGVNTFLLYTLIYYIVTMVFETLTIAAYNKK